MYKQVESDKNGTFVIDKTLGRMAKFQMDYKYEENPEIEKVILFFPNGSELTYPLSTTDKPPFIAKFDFLEVKTILIIF